MQKHHFLLLGVIWLLGFVIAPAPGHAQENGTCPAVVEQALNALTTNCGGLERNTACYGYNLVNATFSDPQPEGFFSQPSDIASIVSLQSIETTPFNPDDNTWGVAVMNLQANVPNTLPGQSVLFMLVGDTQVENAVAPDEAFLPSAPVEATVMNPAELHTAPDLTSRVVAEVEPDVTLLVDAVSADGRWYRTAMNGVTAWIGSGALIPSPTLETLPIYDEGIYTPMQAFYFNTGIGRPACNEAEPVLAIQSPEGITVNLTVNGAEIHVGSLINLQTLPENQMRLTVVEGRVETADGRLIRTGQTIVGALDENNNITAWSQVRDATEKELATGERTRAAFARLGGDISSDGTCEPVVHTVQDGENLFRIALRYNTSAPEIASANGLENTRRIYRGQQLVIPCPGSGFVNIPDAGLGAAPPAPGPTGGQTVQNVAGIDCTNFRPTSPLQGMPYGELYFYWDPAPGAELYRVHIYTGNGDRVAGGETTETRLYVRTTEEAIGQLNIYSWEVEALRGGEVVCRTERVTVQRDPNPNQQPVAGGPPFTASWTCISTGTLQVTYSNVPPGDTAVEIKFDDSMAGPNQGGTFSVPPTSASQIFGGVFTVSNGRVKSLPSGTLINLSPASPGC